MSSPREALGDQLDLGQESAFCNHQIMNKVQFIRNAGPPRKQGCEQTISNNATVDYYYFVSVVSLRHWSATDAVNLIEEHAGKALGLSGPTPSIRLSIPPLIKIAADLDLFSPQISTNEVAMW